MKLKYNTDDMIIHTISNKEANYHLILLENRNKLPDFTDSDDLIAQLYHNLAADLSRWTGTPIELTVVTLTDFILTRGNPFPALKKALKAMKSGFSEKNEGVIVAGTEIANHITPKPYRFLNVVLPYNNKKPALPRKPVDDNRNWMISVPSFLWTKISRSVKDDGAGINLLGYIYRGCLALIDGQTEMSIYNQMKAYHRGDFGEPIVVDTMAKFKKFMKDLKIHDILSIDSETDNLQRINNEILSLQFVLANGIPPEVDKNLKMYFLPWEHDDTPWTGKELKLIKKELRNHFERVAHQQTHVYQNAKFDIHQLTSILNLRNYAAELYDVSAGSFSLEENQKILKSINISAYALEHMEQCAEYVRPSDLVIKKSDRSRMREFSLPDICRYGVIDVLTPYFLMCEQVAAANARKYPNFFKFVTKQIGHMIYAMTVMEHNGIPINKGYLQQIASPVGPLADQIRSAVEDIKEMKQTKQANIEIAKDNPNWQSKGLFGSVTAPQIWDIRKKVHLRKLFFDVCNLEPLSFQKDGEGKLDARFQKTYRHHPVVKKFTEYQKLTKLKTAFADAIYGYLTEDPDMMSDERLRPFFTYLDVLTGRSSTVRPSTQQIPMHGKNAKIIKQQFETIKKRVLGKTDYAAHEVRVSGNLSEDEAILNTVDTINDMTLKFRIAVGPDVEKTGATLKADGDIHVRNYFTFFEVKITKEDPRRQDAKVAVFSVTYGAKAGSVARKMLEEALTSAEDKLLICTDPKEAKKLKALVQYLKSEDAQQDYYEKAVELLDVLAKRWKGLSEHIEELCAEVRVEHVLFGPHGRPRHLWGHISPDKFAGFAMDRRAFNSKGQGYASDIGYQAIYLMNQAKWKLFDSRRLKTDILTINAVHDSAMNDMAFQYFPIYTYLQEHSMTTLAEGFYKKHFGIKTRSHYGFDMEAGMNESNLISWNKRPADLPDFTKKLGEMSEVSPKMLKKTVEDAEIIAELRLGELKSNHKGYVMRLLDDSWYDRFVPRLNCFQSL